MSDKKQFAVLGLGRFGRNVALTLEKMGYEVLCVEKDADIAAHMAEVLTNVVIFDIRDAQALDQAGISNFDTVVIATTNLEASLMATMLCSERNIPEIVVKAIDERHSVMAKKLGATKMIFPERDTARRVAMHLISNNTVDYMEIAADITILSLNTPKKFLGKNLMESNWRSTYNVNIIAVVRNNQTIVTPPPTLTFQADDKIFVIGSQAALSKFEQDISD
ncbi:MAG: TrkA family potassium uptake protein [Selenomonadaceae bacterium]|nr:TrkA family potassium uptake protein [Selenomonadaceae bacterium]